MDVISKKVLRAVCLSDTLHRIAFILIISITSSCESFLEVELPKSKIDRVSVFSDDITAESAVTGLYANLIATSGFAGGDLYSVTALTGLSSDELNYNYTGFGGELYAEFENNSISINNEVIFRVWKSMYRIIYQANAIIEGVKNSSGISDAARKQLMGEALCIRAITNFYLANLFGDVPIVTTTSYQENQSASRAPLESVLFQIETDLLEASELLTENYPTAERIRPNKYVAIALLARLYLFQGKWKQAEDQASIVINSGFYSIVEDLNSVFLANSNEAIWQLKPNLTGRNTNEGVLFILWYAPIFSSIPFSMTEDLVNSFSEDDLRRSNWINANNFMGTYYYPFKYKVGYVAPDAPLTEYSMVIRLAEMVLLRAESRLWQNNLVGTIEDIDTIRRRAGLDLISETSPDANIENLHRIVQQERRHELFAEWGHRWLDLKRTSSADTVLGNIKDSWDSHDVLYPIPQAERNLNASLAPQNPGY